MEIDGRRRETAFERNDATDLSRLLADDVVLEFSDSLPAGGTFVGKHEFQAFRDHLHRKYEYFHYGAHAVLAVEDHFVVPSSRAGGPTQGIRLRSESRTAELTW